MDDNFKKLYGKEYFTDRFPGQNKKRELSYIQEYGRIKKYVRSGKALDIGCGMGNFLNTFEIGWEKYGIEISDFAANEAKRNGIKIIDYADGYENFFDLIIFRGVIQHLDTPLYTLKQAIAMLKPGGYIIFLATPNSNSLYYKLFGTLPMLDDKRNFLIPSDTMIKNILKNFGFDIKEVYYPYIDSPYASYILDHLKFIANCFGFHYKFSFWKNMMEIYAQKKGTL